MSDEYECPECGCNHHATMDICPRCYRNHELQSDLRELIEQWRDGTLPREGTFNQAADQLEDVIDS